MAPASSLNNLGAVATPYQIVRYIVLELLDYWKSSQKTDPNNKGYKKIHVLDPAVGDGRFLIEFLKLSENRIKNPLYCYGLDINARSIDSAKNKFGERKDLKSTKISLKVGNALLGCITAPKGWNNSWPITKLNKSIFLNQNLEGIDLNEFQHPFHWFLEWQKVISNNGFDFILGNPPYGVKFSRPEKILFRKVYQAFDPEIESYILFLERSIHLLRHKGLLGMIIPNNILSNYHYRNIRKFLLQNADILKIVNFNSQIFTGIHVETCAIFLQRNIHQKERGNNKIQFRRIENSLDFRNIPQTENFILQRDVWKNPYELFLPSLDIRIQKILEKIQKNSTPLGKFVQISRGIELGYTSPNTNDIKLDSDYVPLIAGRSIRKFSIDNNVRYIKFNKHNKSIFKDINQYLQPKLLLRRIGHELIAAYDPNHLFCVCDVYIIVLKSNEPTIQFPYLEALLNSKLMSFYLMQRFTSVKTIFPKIPIKFLKDLPIKIPSEIKKIQEITQELHKIPWRIREKASWKELINEINSEIFQVYEISIKEQDIVNNSFD